MKLELFKFVDDTLILLEKKSYVLEEVSLDIDNFFNNTFGSDDNFLNTKSRIKSKESLREKILRRNLYTENETPENILYSLSDLIGLRIECRFIEDEEKVYQEILKVFNLKVDEKYYTNKINPRIMLNLERKQPEIQDNGFEIYKIDGKYEVNGIYLNFELQIKSMVNVFWSEIDHRILYKNFNYVLTEDFYRDIMSSIKDNLSMIDRQLMVVFNHLNDLDSREVRSEKSQFMSMLSKIIHDVYIGKIRDELGFVIGFKRSTDVIVNYLFLKDSNNGLDKYGEDFIRILNRITEISETSIEFDQYIEFERTINYKDEFTRKIGERFLDIINKDFRWNLFFKVIFEIEQTDKSIEFESFLDYLYKTYNNNINSLLDQKVIENCNKEKISEDILYRIADNFIKEMDIEFINEKNVKAINNHIEELLVDINSYEEWLENAELVGDKIIKYKI